MTTDRTPLRRPRLWLATGGILAVLGIAILWPLQQVGQVCILIYPAPPGCGAQEPRWVPLVGIGLVIAAFAAMVVVYFTVPRSRTVIIILAGAIVVIVALAAAIVGLSQLGIWDPYQPPVIVN
jgi:peptidoglycan/LPS O-acetylase OafA/YrhL